MVIRFFGILSLLLGVVACEPSIEYQGDLNYNLVPEPREITIDKGVLHFPDGLFYVEGDPVFQDQSNFLSRQLTSFGLREFKSHQHVNIKLVLNQELRFNPEAYTLRVEENGITLESATIQGINRAISSLEQLILLNMQEGEAFLPFINLEDSPRFGHRGLLLDCSRHFFETEVILKYIDLLAFFKMNTLHWHLTEDQGWRIEIEKYPLLNEVASYRKEKDGSVYGGYYTKDEIRRVVEYAGVRGIEVIPEIELPGHSQAAIAAYPHLSCTGQQVEVANDWGVFKEIYCAGNDSVFKFLEDVLTEVMELFPSQKIHIGGDEAPKTRWEACLKCQKRITNEGLADEHELQSYFIQRIQKFLNDNGRELIGWDEILEGGLAEGAIVQSWRGMEGGIEAVTHGHGAIMSPTSHCYFDYDLRSIDMKKVYEFDPIPDGLTPKEQEMILGGECNMWTERVPDENNLDSKVFPRILAMTEVLWTYKGDRDFDEFVERVQKFYPILEKMEVNYGEESIPLTHEMRLANGKAFLSLTPYSSDLELFYSWDKEGEQSQKVAYSEPIAVQESGKINLNATRNGEDYGEVIQLSFANHQSIDAEVEYDQPYSKWYTAGGDKGLVDSRLGGLDFRDGAWQGFWGDDAICTLNLKTPQSIESVSINFYQYVNSWILIPKSIQVKVSVDGEEWLPFGSAYSTSLDDQRGKFIESIKVENEPMEAQYVRVKVKNYGKLPDWHEAAGMEAWIFMDEIVVQ